MFPIPTALLCSSVLLASALALQDPTPTQDPKADPVPPAAKQEPKSAPDAAALKALVERLGAESYRERLDAEKQLREVGKEALPALREALDQGADAETEWRARRLIRQIERADGTGLRQRGEDAPQQQPQDAQAPEGGARRGQRLERRTQEGDIEQRFDDLFRNLERDFGMDIPRHRFFEDGFFQDLQSQMDAMRQELERAMQQGGPTTGQRPGLGSGQGFGTGRGMTMQMGPDGVRVEVTERNEKGEEVKKVYEAPDMETFREKHPGVLDKQGMGGIQFFMNRPGPGGGMRVLPPGRLDRGQPDLDDEQGLVAPPDDRRLGVTVRNEIPPDVRAFLELEEGRGLMVEQVQKGTLAEALGLRPGDIVLSIGEAAIGSTADVQKALAPIEAGKPVAVKVNRRGRELELSAPKPAAPAPAEKKLEARKAEGGGEIR